MTSFHSRRLPRFARNDIEKSTFILFAWQKTGHFCMALILNLNGLTGLVKIKYPV